MNNVKELFEQKKNEPIDPFGINQKSLNSDEYNQSTPYDNFLFEDCLRIVSIGNTMNQLKTAFETKLDKNTGLYKVTVGDYKSEYYYFATMLNRMTNDIYSRKVYRSAKLFNNIINGIKNNYTKLVEDSIKTVEPLHFNDQHFSL